VKRNAEAGDRNRVDVSIRARQGVEILRLRLGWLGKRLLRTSSASLPPAKRNTFRVATAREAKHLPHRRRPWNGILSRTTRTEWAF